MGILYFLLASAGFFPLFFRLSLALDMISLSRSLRDGETCVSSNGIFEMGFFSPGTSTNRYLGIWYRNIPTRTAIWVANRASPVNDSSGILIIKNSTGNLVILSKNRNVEVWSSNISRRVKYPLAQLLDSGNFILREGLEGKDPNLDYAWQSFDYPTDTLVPGMKLGWDLRTGINRRLASWKNGNDPAPSDFSCGMEHGAFPEIVIRKGLRPITRTGPWNGYRFSGIPSLTPSMYYNFSFVSNENETYYTYNVLGVFKIMTVLNETNGASVTTYAWLEAEKYWQPYITLPSEICEHYGRCGAYGICSFIGFDGLPQCLCFKGFKPRYQEKWDSMNWSDGCVRILPLNCSSNDAFVKVAGIILPDTANSWLNKSMSLQECRVKCLSNCSCTAYANADIRGAGSGCVIWFNDLLDVRELGDAGQDINLRMPYSDPGVKHGFKMKKLLLILLLTATSAFFGTLIIGCYCLRLKSNPAVCIQELSKKDEPNKQMEENDMDLAVFGLPAISVATNNFSAENKLGQGGFGPVYKGIFENGQEVAIKRLSATSHQGQDEFKNEVKLISNLQHRNLVKLLGCCYEGEERMLIYEYMPNKSLNNFIFDKIGNEALGWTLRYSIIRGIARGLLYLHEDSRLRIIHRDLKASNVLLDREMNPKISDFGMAKTFGSDQTEGNTKRVFGTYGYMAPEYAIGGLFSVKSDVFSFGILMLEILSGTKIRDLVSSAPDSNLVVHAWTLWVEKRPLDLVDETLRDSYNASQALRCVHISLLCVQQHPRDRPNMSSVILMLGSDNELPHPKPPAIFKDGKNQHGLAEFSMESHLLQPQWTSDLSETR
ncbi:hypothetical protein QQ045_008636 [Rhodiola kirilowii]